MPRKSVAVQAAQHPSPITLDELARYDLVYSAPPGFPLLTNKQALLVRQRAENPNKTWKACAAAAGYTVNSQNAGRSLISPDVRMYLDAISHGETLNRGKELGQVADLRAAAIKTLASALSDPDQKTGVLAAKVLLDSLPLTEDDKLDFASLTDEQLSGRVQHAIRELGDLELRLVTVLPPQRIERTDTEQTAPVDVAIESDSPERSQEPVQSILDLRAVTVWADSTDGDTGTGDEPEDEADDEPDRGDD